MSDVKGASLLVSTAAKATVIATKSTKVAFDPASITSPNFNDTTLAIPDVLLGDFVMVAPKTSVPAGGLCWGFVSANGTVTLRFYGINAAAAVDFASQDFNVLVFRL